MDTSPTLWLGFFAIIVLLLAFDLGLLHKKDSEINVKQSLKLSLGYFIISLCFGLFVTLHIGQDDGSDFFTGYFIEKSLSLDNIFIIAMVFEHFAIPQRFQHRVLFWGILGAVIMRGLLILGGVELVHLFHPILYLFGAFLLFSGLRMLFMKESEQKTVEESKLLILIKRFIPVSDELHGNKFLIKQNRKWIATPLLMTLVFIELADVIFAVDSVPAVLAVTTDTFIVYTSNIFAVLGLRALYFALAAVLHRFEYLKYSLALVLMFIGSKIFLHPIYPISSPVSLSVTLALLVGGVVLSLHKTKHK
ncbi:MAG TPA: TerC family protein [Rickettsiales bacterium]|nr:TerC family protein [Rickettsiales bacterium]